jgi:hypothetical protein
MSFLQSLPIPRRISSRVWLLTLPSALVSFERRQGVPKLPIKKARFLGLPLIAVGVALGILGGHSDDAPETSSRNPLSRLSSHPATIGGVLVLGGLSLLLRSTALAVYSIGVTIAASTDAITVEPPSPAELLGRGD